MGVGFLVGPDFNSNLTIGIPESQLISNTRLFIQSNAWGRMAEIN